ncbi:MAG: iron-containing alcohol dehydrogenase [Gammaproteobacteria bacterium]|nr:iron-containing alcohol dehydrogenase [Gammaproteobacteria bacterium]MBQ0838503.1 iron-containing alcohol dehydrogenase [Gammaproteobacteria bacterium]
MLASITTPRIMLIGGGAVAEVAAVMAKLGCSKPLVVSDPYMRDSGKIAHVTDVLDTASIAWQLFADTVPEPSDDVVIVGADIINKGDFDCVIALGGGSPIDTAKAMTLLARGGGKISDYKVPQQPNEPGLPIIAIPTTAGTGSEVTKVIVITDKASDEKMLIMGLACLPAAAIVDYELTYSVPYRTTADTGIDSLTHAIEAYVSAKHNPYTDTLALSAMGLIARNIRSACNEPDNTSAREAMMLAATQAGMAFSNASVCLVHGMSRPIGAFFHVAHGLSNAMLLPAVTAFSASFAMERYADCARAMGLVKRGSDTSAAVKSLLAELQQLNKDLQVPSPKEYGIDEEKYFSLLTTMAEQAMASGSPNNNPRVPSVQEMAALYKEVWQG